MPVATSCYEDSRDVSACNHREDAALAKAVLIVREWAPLSILERVRKG